MFYVSEWKKLIGTDVTEAKVSLVQDGPTFLFLRAVKASNGKYESVVRDAKPVIATELSWQNPTNAMIVKATLSAGEMIGYTNPIYDKIENAQIQAVSLAYKLLRECIATE